MFGCWYCGHCLASWKQRHYEISYQQAHTTPIHHQQLEVVKISIHTHPSPVHAESYTLRHAICCPNDHVPVSRVSKRWRHKISNNPLPRFHNEKLYNGSEWDKPCVSGTLAKYMSRWALFTRLATYTAIVSIMQKAICTYTSKCIHPNTKCS